MTHPTWQHPALVRLGSHQASANGTPQDFVDVEEGELTLGPS